MKPSLFFALGASGLLTAVACGGDFEGVVEGADGGVVAVRDAAPADTGSPTTPDSGILPDAGPARPDAGPKDAGPAPVDAGPVPSYKWACSASVSYYGNGSNGQGYGTEAGCNTGKASYCDVAQEATACDPNVDRGNSHFLCSDCVRSNQQNGGWFVPAQRCGCQFY
jgi:hypothetical protein